MIRFDIEHILSSCPTVGMVSNIGHHIHNRRSANSFRSEGRAYTGAFPLVGSSAKMFSERWVISKYLLARDIDMNAHIVNQMVMNELE